MPRRARPQRAGAAPASLSFEPRPLAPPARASRPEPGPTGPRSGSPRRRWRARPGTTPALPSGPRRARDPRAGSRRSARTDGGSHPRRWRAGRAATLSPILVSRKPRVHRDQAAGEAAEAEARRDAVGAHGVPHAGAADGRLAALEAGGAWPSASRRSLILVVERHALGMAPGVPAGLVLGARPARGRGPSAAPSC